LYRKKKQLIYVTGETLKPTQCHYFFFAPEAANVVGAQAPGDRSAKTSSRSDNKRAALNGSCGGFASVYVLIEDRFVFGQ
jgi:hypothetical protein